MRFILFLIGFLIFQAHCLAQEDPLFDVDLLKREHLVSYSYEASRLGLTKYTSGSIPDSIEAKDVRWLVVNSHNDIDKRITEFTNVRYLELSIGKSMDLSFLSTFKRIEILQLGCVIDIPHEISYLKNVSIMGILLSTGNNNFSGIRDLPRLKILRIENGMFQSIPPHLNTLDSLYHFALFDIRKYNPDLESLTTITDWSGLKNNRTIEKITIHRCGLTSIPEELSGCSNLKTLILQENLLTDFTHLNQLTQIEKLSLESSLPNIKDLPEELLNLRQLKVIDLRQYHGNHKLTLNGIARLSSLEELTCKLILDIDKREQVPEEIFSMITLKKLVLCDSRGIKTLKGIEKLKRLEFLDVESCTFSPNVNELVALPNLKWLNLSNNPVINFSLINQISSIETLVLSNCSIPEFSFREGDFKNLKSLDLRNNPDCKIIGPVTNLPKLKVIYGSVKLLPENTRKELKAKGVKLNLSTY